MIRIEKLRQMALQHRHSNDEFLYKFHKKYGDNELSMCYPKYADAFDFAFSELTPSISPGELVVGEIMNGLTASEREEWETIYKPLAAERTKQAGGGQDSHMAIEYELLLSQGLNGIIEHIEGCLKDCDPEQAEFYSAAKSCLLAVIKHSENYSALANKLAADEPDEIRKNELIEIAGICKKVPAQQEVILRTEHTI